MCVCVCTHACRLLSLGSSVLLLFLNLQGVSVLLNGRERDDETVESDGVMRERDREGEGERGRGRVGERASERERERGVTKPVDQGEPD